MDNADRDFVMRSLCRLELPVQESVRFQKLGDAAFDLLIGVAGDDGLRAGTRVIALRRLSLLTRQQCQGRKEEVLEIAVRLTADEKQIVRSAAVNMAINTTRILERYPERAIRPQNLPGARPSLRERIQEAVGDALKRGLHTGEARYAEDFLASRV